jgi:hypothetical protein
MARREDPPEPAQPIQAVPVPEDPDPTWQRLENQIVW